MQSTQRRRFGLGTLAVSIASLGLGVLIGATAGDGQAQTVIPTEHKGVAVTALGVLPEESLQKQIDLNGYVLQMREITLEPGGQIARHSHATRPGLVYTLSGSWTEGRPSGERDYPAGEKIALLEDEATEHWFWNREDEPVTVVVCDMVPSS
jgi:quercetin dioxygenase-like cupin family protein